MAMGAGGKTTLAELRATVLQEADCENDPNIGTAEILSYINGSYLEFYDLLVTTFGEDYYTAQATITTDGTNQLFALPDGTLYAAAPAFYKGMLVEGNTGAGNNGWVTLKKFNLGEKNRFNLYNQAAVSGYFWPRYRLHGSKIMLQPLPAAGLLLRLWYAPKLTPLAADADPMEDWGGWLEYVVIDAALKCVAKQERDVSVLAGRKTAMKARIELAAQNRDLGEPNTVTETTPEGFGPFGFGPYGGVGL
jgi:hypothetical protein